MSLSYIHLVLYIVVISEHNLNYKQLHQLGCCEQLTKATSNTIICECMHFTQIAFREQKRMKATKLKNGKWEGENMSTNQSDNNGSSCCYYKLFFFAYLCHPLQIVISIGLWHFKSTETKQIAIVAAAAAARTTRSECVLHTLLSNSILVDGSFHRMCFVKAKK